VWEEKAGWAWRLPIAAGWLISVPYVNSTTPIRLNRWTLFEVGLLIALAISAWWPTRQRVSELASASGS
jgi:hypothetical protein